MVSFFGAEWLVALAFLMSNSARTTATGIPDSPSLGNTEIKAPGRRFFTWTTAWVDCRKPKQGHFGLMHQC